MSCQTCGHPAEGDIQPHNLGCARSTAARRAAADAVVVKETYVITDEQLAKLNRCEHDGCSKSKKPWSGRGARPKYCADGHK